jgi:hypothetical protein
MVILSLHSEQAIEDAAREGPQSCLLSVPRCFSHRNGVRFALALVDALGIIAARRGLCRVQYLPRSVIARPCREERVAVVVYSGGDGDGCASGRFEVLCDVSNLRLP